jgi:hypothetical protein
MTKIKLCFLTCVLSFALSGQEQQKTILVFYINDANINGVDYSKEYIEKESYITFYMSLSDSTLSMANVISLDKTQSFGFLKPYNMITKNEQYDSLPCQRSYYNWNYANSYNDIKGTAHIELIQINKDEKKYFILKMFTDQQYVSIFKGYSYDLYDGLITEIGK